MRTPQCATNKEKRANYQPPRSEPFTCLSNCVSYQATCILWAGQSPPQEKKSQRKTWTPKPMYKHEDQSEKQVLRWNSPSEDKRQPVVGAKGRGRPSLTPTESKMRIISHNDNFKYNFNVFKGPNMQGVFQRILE